MFKYISSSLSAHAVLCGNSIHVMFPQKLFKILTLEATTTEVLQRQENKLTEPYRRLCLPILSASVHN